MKGRPDMTSRTIQNVEEVRPEPRESPDVFGVLSHDIRVRILFLLYENVELTYTEILDALRIDPGLLNFHLRKIRELVEQTEEGTYLLSEMGRVACETWKYARDRLRRTSSALRDPFEAPDLTGPLVLRRVMAFVLDAALLFFSSLLFLDSNFWSLVSDVFTLSLSLELLGRVSYEVLVHYSVLFFAAYIVFTILEAYKGQTPGKYVLGIRLSKVDGRKAQFLDSAVRNIGKVFLLPLDLVVGIALYCRRGYLRFFDYYTETKVERIG